MTINVSFWNFTCAAPSAVTCKNEMVVVLLFIYADLMAYRLYFRTATRRRFTQLLPVLCITGGGSGASKSHYWDPNGNIRRPRLCDVCGVYHLHLLWCFKLSVERLSSIDYCCCRRNAAGYQRFGQLPSLRSDLFFLFRSFLNKFWLCDFFHRHN